jgi:hypothetical protein
MADLKEKKRVAELPIGVGSRDSQAVFLRENQGFTREYPKLHDLSARIFIRGLPPPDEKEVERLQLLPESDPTVVKFEDKLTAERIVFFLGRIAVDDLGEILMLSGNGYGFGAYKIVRGMYERVVTAMYIAKDPSEARKFALQSAIDKFKLWERTVAAFPDMAKQCTEDQLRSIKEESDRARKQLREPLCPKCRQPLPDGPWTRKGLDVMARDVDDGLYRLYGQFYLEGTAQSHANSLGMERRLKRTEQGGWTYKDTSEEEGRFALNLGHSLVLKMLKLQNEYFQLGLDAEIQERIEAYVSIWKPVGPSRAAVGN